MAAVAPKFSDDSDVKQAPPAVEYAGLAHRAISLRPPSHKLSITTIIRVKGLGRAADGNGKIMSVMKVRGIEVAYDDTGEGSTVVVLLHGFPLNRAMWDAQVEALRASCRVITPDLRGLGETGATQGPATMEEMASDVAALLDALGVGRVVLGGLSMGGYVALAFLRQLPERVCALILADTRAGADSEEARRNREEVASLALREGMGPIADAMIPKLLSADTLERSPEIVSRVREMVLSTNPEGAAAAQRGMAARRDQTDLLSRLGVPTLIIVGSEDKITPPDEAEAMQRTVRGSRLELIEGAAHLSNVERPNDFNRVLLEFLKNFRTRTAGGDP